MARSATLTNSVSDTDFERQPGPATECLQRGRVLVDQLDDQGRRGLGYPGLRVVSRRVVLTGLLLAAVFAAPARAQPVELMPGVTYEKQVRFTLHGPVGVNVLTAPRPGGLYSLQPVLSNELVQGTEKLTAIEQRLSGATTTAGVNGDFANGGRPDGFLERNGALDHDPRTARTSTGIDTGGGLHFDRVSLYGYWQGSKTRRPFIDINEPPRANDTALFTPAWGPATPAASNSLAVVLRPFPPAAPNTDLVGTSAQVVPGGAVAIPPDGAVLVARGEDVAALQAEASVGQSVRIRFALLPDWPSAGVTAGLGGGPLLVKNGRPVFKAGESIPVLDLALRQPRTAVGQRADGGIVMISVDGGLPGSGMTNFELGQTLASLGVVTGVALAGGSSAGMAFDGRQLSAAPAAGAPGIADALLVEYAGVVASLPSAPVVSPNNDGANESETLSFKVVRPSNVTVQLKGPDGGLRVSTQQQLGPGTYPFTWNARRADGTPEQEGLWSFTVSAVDDLGRASSHTRPFTLDLTLGSPAAVSPALTVPRAKPRSVATFALTRQARVSQRIETAKGTVLRTLGTVTAGPGTLSVAWNGKTTAGGIVYSGRYVARVTATSAIGTSDLTAPFTVRRRVG
jgi:phosphodiester glycosidase/flagellar hook capping protein FlgD